MYLQSVSRIHLHINKKPKKFTFVQNLVRVISKKKNYDKNLNLFKRNLSLQNNHS